MRVDTNCRAVLQAEIETCMRLLGAASIDQLGPRFVSHFASPLIFCILHGGD